MPSYVSLRDILNPPRRFFLLLGVDLVHSDEVVVETGIESVTVVAPGKACASVLIATLSCCEEK